MTLENAALLRSSLAVLVGCSFLGVMSCAAVLGLDEFTDVAGTGAGGSGGSGASSGTGGSGGQTTGGGGAGGGGVTGECTVQGTIHELVESPLLRAKDLHLVPREVSGHAMVVTAIGAKTDGVNPSVMRVVSTDSGGSVQIATFDTGSLSDINVYMVSPAGADEVHVFAATSDWAGRIVVKVGVNGVLPINPNTDVTPLIVGSGCGDVGSNIRELAVQVPVDLVNPVAAMTCQINASQEVFLSSFAAATPLFGGTGDLEVGAFLKVGNAELMLSGDDVTAGSFARLGPNFLTPIELKLETAPGRVTTVFSALPNEDGSAKLFLATLDDPSFVPARVFVGDFDEAALGSIGTVPTPGMSLIAELDGINDLVKTHPLTRASGYLFGGGVDVSATKAHFSWFDGGGSFIVRNLLIHTSDGVVTSAGAAAADLPSLIVAWAEETAGTVKLRSKSLVCVGG